ncbi:MULTISPECIES: GTPase-associated protein 1-related protein [Streptomyces]|uniref:GTPase-associated protein 1-related protein n=1 Tax=Streptomyces TaxID=1883 RepID=UPI0009978E05|nr:MULTISPECIES: GTPase-associated protein 1-related protein [Streptomyces]MDX2921328.1 GTPase-associated protein 1-related protein [Streptomyces sp. NE06-03C]MDX3609790.1 GTPase-associated protein 1-related protein [Streptomyces sp. FL06-04B]MDX3734175.1 GTPase-associated protein 1-related protein [Streptomyces sp. ID01-15D]
MSLAQVHYTSAAPGDEGTAGRFTAVGPGVSGALLAEIEPLVRYELPDGAPDRPSDGELRSLPQSFTYAALSDGSRLVSRSAPVRATGGGAGPGIRFHAHAVHLPPGVPLPGDRLPVEAWRSPHWVAVTPGGAIPDPLALSPGPAAVSEGLDDFAVSRGPWLAAVLADLRRASEPTEPGGRPVVLVERQCADVARWLGLASVTLPRESAERLTFTTYTRRPESSAVRVAGVLPEDAEAARAAGLRVHVCAERPPSGGSTDDAWAATAARVWRSRSPELFREARELPGEPFAPGPLAVTALCAGIALGPDERAAAAGWAADRPYALDAKRTGRLVEALASPGVDDRTGPEFDAVGRLFGALEGRCPAAVTAPLAAMLVTEAVRGGNGSLELPRRDAFVGPEGAAVAERLAPEILTELGDTAGSRSVARTVQLLRVARLLGVDGTDSLPGVIDRLAPALLTEAAAQDEEGTGAAGAPDFAPTLLELLDEQFEVRTALLGALDRLAPRDPGAVARFLERVALPFTGTQALPHLRMCAELPGAMATLGGDRAAVWHRVLRAAGLSPFAEPLVLRTAVGLVWADRAPTIEEARLLLDAATSDSHRAAGTWARLVDAALGASAAEPSATGTPSTASSAASTDEAASLAHDLLRGFPREIGGRERAGLLLLDLVRELRTGAPEPGWAERVRTLCAQAEPVDPALRERAHAALVERLLAPDRPGAELYDFVHGDDAELIAAYDRTARTETVRTRLRAQPAYAADCFTVWTAHPHAGETWPPVAAALLDEVLRPAVRAMSAEDVAEVEATVGRTGSSGRADAFRTWNRSSTLGRLGRRIAGRVRRG